MFPELGGPDRSAGYPLALRDPLPGPLDPTGRHAGGDDRGVRHLTCQRAEVGPAGCDHDRGVGAAAELERAGVPAHDLAVELERLAPPQTADHLDRLPHSERRLRASDPELAETRPAGAEAQDRPPAG